MQAFKANYVCIVAMNETSLFWPTVVSREEENDDHHKL